MRARVQIVVCPIRRAAPTTMRARVGVMTSCVRISSDCRSAVMGHELTSTVRTRSFGEEIHMIGSRSLRACVALIAAFACGAFAQGTGEETAERPYVSKIEHYAYDVDKDGRSSLDVTHRVQVLQEGAIENLKTY